VIAAIGPRTAKDARKVGLGVSAVAREQTVEGLITAVSNFPCRTPRTSSTSDARLARGPQPRICARKRACSSHWKA
jgi:hypothetical protein